MNYIKELSTTNDTINIWLTDSNTYNKDTLFFELKYLAHDSLNKLSLYTDTVKMIYKPQKISKKIKVLKPQNLLNINFNIKSNLDLNKKLTFTTSTPVEFVDTTKIHLSIKKDTTYTPVSFELKKDSTLARTFIVDFKLNENTKYTINIDSGAIRSIYSQTNQLNTKNFSTKSLSEYGILKLTIDSINTPVIIQLLNAQSKIAKQKFLNKQGQIIFDYILPGQYSIKLIFDKNNDRKWTSGNYLKHIQPEKVRFYPQTIKIRENWDTELNWTPDK
jgi:hypothetical protein